MKTIRTSKKVFYALYFVLLPINWLILAIGLTIEYFKNNSAYSLEKTLFAFGFLSLIPVFLSLIFLRYKLTFNEEKFSYRNLLSKKTLRFDEIDFARFEHGYKDRSEKFVPSFRFVIYPKSEANYLPIVINCAILENFKMITEKIESLSKLKQTKSYNH